MYIRHHTGRRAHISTKPEFMALPGWAAVTHSWKSHDLQSARESEQGKWFFDTKPAPRAEMSNLGAQIPGQ
jgi:hypothetical protein